MAGKVCKMINLFSFIAQKRVLLILKSLNEGYDSFSEIKKYLWNVNSKILSQRLTQLQEHGYVHREIVCDKPVKIKYSLTSKWKSFACQVDNIENWMKEWEEEEIN